MAVPFLDLKRQYAAGIAGELEAALLEVVRNCNYIGTAGSEYILNFEKAACEYTGSKYALGVSSGTDALLLALMALDIGPGDEVITTSHSFFATAAAIVRLGATPVFADTEQVTGNIDPAKIPAAITSKTKAILPVHLYGQCADMEPLLAIAREHGLAVVEDTAQAMGATHNGRQAGTMGDIGCFSFFPSKNLGALGDAGMVLTDNPDLAEKMRLMRTHGAKPKNYHLCIGGNFRMDNIQAAALSVKLPHLDSWLDGRRKAAALYMREFEKLTLSEDVIRLPQVGQENVHTYHLFVVRVIGANRRAELMEFLRKRGIESNIYYPCPFHLQKCFEAMGYHEGDFPVSEAVCNENLGLPIFPEMREDEVGEVVRAVERFLI